MVRSSDCRQKIFSLLCMLDVIQIMRIVGGRLMTVLLRFLQLGLLRLADRFAVPLRRLRLLRLHLSCWLQLLYLLCLSRLYAE